MEKRLLWWKCDDTNGEHDLVKDGIGEITLKEDFKVYWVSFLDGMQRVLMFTDDLALATAAQEVRN
ncbi:UNVERIFIED_CONTAM: Vacuolar protein sorting-associated protein 13C [Trichonephila clavipes]